MYGEKTITVARCWCDQDGCEQEADGPCIHCGKHLCLQHGEKEDAGMTIRGYTILVCPEHRKELNVDQLVVSARLVENRWATWRRHQRGKVQWVAEPIVFKTEASLWELLKDGTKTWDARWWDIADDRCSRLWWRKAWQVGDDADRRQEKEVSFLNKATGEVLTFEYLGVEFTPWAPGWGFILIGKRIGEE